MELYFILSEHLVKTEKDPQFLFLLKQTTGNHPKLPKTTQNLPETT